VSGTATGSAGTKTEPPNDIFSVTVQVDNGQPIDATLSPATKLKVTFTVGVAIVLPGQHVVTVTAVDDIGRTLARQITIIVSSNVCRPGVQWSNWAGNAGIARGTVTPSFTCTPTSLVDAVGTVQQAEISGMHVHAFGSKWSFSDCAITSDVLVDMRQLNRPVQAVQQALNTDVQSPDLVYQVEAGITLKDLYTALNNYIDPRLGQPMPLALETMPGSGSMTMGGALSTGSHGSDRSFELVQHMPPFADSVLAIHLIGVGGTQFWIEPSAGITDPTKLASISLVPQGDPPATNLLPDNIIYDDSVFEAVLVSLGCMGIIYSLVLRVRPHYDLIETTAASTWARFKETALVRYFNDPQNRFLEVVIDPYPNMDGDNRCLVITRQEGDAIDMSPCRPGNLNQVVSDMVQAMFWAELPGLNVWHAAELGDILLRHKDDPGPVPALTEIVNFVLQQAPELRPTLTDAYWNFMSTWQQVGVCGGQSYAVMDTEVRGVQGPTSQSGGYSIEFSMPAIDADGRLSFAPIVDDLIATISRADTTFLAGWLALRFTGRTRAALGMQQWDQTCAIEISTLPRIDGELQLLATLYELMRERGGIPHWGQLLDITVPGHGSLYRRFEEWRQVYSRFSRGFTARTFETDLSFRWQLTSPPPVTPPVSVPDLTGDTFTQAKTALAALGLLITFTIAFTDADFDTVIDQQPSPGATVPRGWVVNVVIAKGRRRSRA
jgi:PASTA domain/FAD binding domain